ncbi:MAG: hypothetical protein QOF64_1379 [Candidatus Binatota bacterium]|jgi:hypothetical protein|nr:hypothetical protein [Candidatus Binatota bacterium]
MEQRILSEPFPSTGKGWIGVPFATLKHPHLDPSPVKGEEVKSALRFSASISWPESL